MKSKIIIQAKSLCLFHESEAAPDVLEAIRNTMLGNPDGIRYRLLNTKEKINRLKNLHFFPLRRKDQLIYVMALIERLTEQEGNIYQSYYVRYVSFSESFTAKSLRAGQTNDRLQKLSNSFLKKGMQQQADIFPFSLKSEGANPEKKVYYAYVEESNLRSMNFTGFFFERIRTASVLSFSRFSPKKDPSFSPLNKSDRARMLKKLNKSYEKHSFYFIDPEEMNQKYYVLKEGNTILAGLKADIAEWKIEQIPGILGRMLKTIIPYLPYLKRIVQKDKFRFLTLDTIFCEKGEEKSLTKLFESVCAHLKINAAMIYLDTQDPIYQHIRAQNNRGLFSRLFKEAKAAVLARFINFSAEEIETFKSNPCYITGTDLS